MPFTPETAWVEPLSIFGNQLNDKTLIKVTLTPDVWLLLRRISDETLSVLTACGKRVVGRAQEVLHDPFYFTTAWTVEGLDINHCLRSDTVDPADPLNNQLMVVGSSDNLRDYVGSFGLPVGGIQRNQPLHLHSSFGIYTDNVKVTGIQAKNLDPDHLTAEVRKFLDFYYDPLYNVTGPMQWWRLQGQEHFRLSLPIVENLLSIRSILPFSFSPTL